MKVLLDSYFPPHTQISSNASDITQRERLMGSSAQNFVIKRNVGLHSQAEVNGRAISRIKRSPSF